MHRVHHGSTLTAILCPSPSLFRATWIGCIPMLLVAFGYRELNKHMPDSGTSFTWAARAFGPWIGWMAGWGLIAATILVLSNLAGIAVEFLFLLRSEEHTSELQSLMRISYAVLCLKKKITFIHWARRI